jgi:hypothetical protein
MKVDGKRLEGSFVFRHVQAFRYRQEAFIHDDRIYVFGGGGLSGVSYSLEHVSVA